MRSKLILALAAFNVILLLSLCFHNVWGQYADAQVAKPAPASEYLMASGEGTGLNAGIVFIVDTRNNLLCGRTLNGKVMDDMQPVDLARIFK